MLNRSFMRLFWMTLMGAAVGQGLLAPGWLMAQQPAFGLGGSSAQAGFPGTNAFYDEWEGIAGATNQWALAIRQSEGWGNIRQASLEETRERAQKGQAVAQLKLGYLYYAGEGVERDYSGAITWLEKAAKSGFAPAEFLLGEASLKGTGLPPDFAAGVEWLNQAAAQDFADAQFQLGLCYLTGGPGVNQAQTRGLKWLLKAAAQGKVLAQQCVGECYDLGEGISPDASEAVKWYRQAAEQGLASAQDLLAGCYANGRGVEKNWVEAAKYYQLAARQGLGLAQANLARCFTKGQGVAKDPGAAAHWWGKAAEQGFPGARFHLGLCYYRGAGLNLDASEAVKCFEAEAKHKHVGAELFLGLCYWSGKGVARDPAQAEQWWREAALQGIKPARYEAGDDTGGDAAEVEPWWREVAELGNGSLQSCLGEFYHFGQGVARDDQEAIRWYERAAGQGDLVALKRVSWLRATSPVAAIRNGTSAVEFAQKAAELTKQKDAGVLDTLAAAYAEAGQFEKAIRAEQRAISLSKREDDQKEYGLRLKLYQEKKPYRAEAN